MNAPTTSVTNAANKARTNHNIDFGSSKNVYCLQRKWFRKCVRNCGYKVILILYVLAYLFLNVIHFETKSQYCTQKIDTCIVNMYCVIFNDDYYVKKQFKKNCLIDIDRSKGFIYLI